MAEGEDKTEQASQRRIEKARDEGQVAVSRELSMLLGLTAGLVAVSMQFNQAAIAHWLAQGLQRAQYDGGAIFGRAGITILMTAAPVAAAAAGAYGFSTLLQTSFLLHTSAIQPDLSKISPLSGIKRLLGPQTAIQVVKAIAKLGIFAALLWNAISRVLPLLASSPYRPVGTLLREILEQATHLVLLLLGAQAAIAGADVLWERYSLAKKLRMSRQDQKDEHKESEGNPQVKQRLRQLARAMAKRRMMNAVPKAAVVVTNPTHYAVALAYERGGAGAPRVVAKGADDVAARIRDLAREHRVPVVANPPLARALFRVEIDTEIPAEHFKAVAEIIAYVWRMRGRAGRR
jgi:flagellar biosynthetic protein FlhB